MKGAIRLLYPDQCVGCGALVEGAHGLCPACWADTPFIRGLCCDACGQPLLGDRADGTAICDDCLGLPRPWAKGRAALLYDGNARRIVLRLKHGDRTDLARPAARWLAEAGRDILTSGVVLVPVPVHWTRLFSRRYNQAAELARALSALTSLQATPDALRRVRKTPVQDGLGVEARFANTELAIRAARPLTGQDIVLVDDVMTSGATLSACATACLAAGATQVSVLVLARVAKTP
ncbi:double zinc ribbon domain-containing protein [Palleronia sp. KMU-117]|uniref:double zinc ribbon domain-containing protein n=1 Tax=Palleronia sp. KMU-117 TaxID=3434108 RepID=UPI003D73E7A6